jgi:FkbM family methyltransferase
MTLSAMGAVASSRWESIRSRLVQNRALAWPSRFYIRYVIKRKVARYRNRIVHHSYGGYDLAISLEDPVADEWYDHDWPLPSELARLRSSRLAPGARVFDIGAHQGVVALMLSRFVEPDGQVVAVEAERHSYEVAVRNRNLNGGSNLQVIHAAAGATDGWLYLRNRLNATVVKGGHIGLSRVPALSVDSLAARYGAPDVVFVDVEGYEHEVLCGARDTLASAATDFFVEVHVGYGLEYLGGSVQMVLDHFDPARFERLVSRAGSELEHYELLPFEPDADVLADRFYLVALARP